MFKQGRTLIENAFVSANTRLNSEGVGVILPYYCNIFTMMNQTTAIVSGGVLIIGLALLFYFISGDGLPQPAKTSSGAVAVEDKTLTLPTPLTTTAAEAIKNTMPETQQAGASATSQEV